MTSSAYIKAKSKISQKVNYFESGILNEPTHQGAPGIIYRAKVHWAHDHDKGNNKLVQSKLINCFGGTRT
jgi:hypothetical protein